MCSLSAAPERNFLMKKNFYHATPVMVLLILLSASALYGAGISLFLDPNNLAPGGVTGIAVIFNRIIPVKTGTLYFLINVPLLLIGLWKFGWKFMLKTVLATILTSIFTNWFTRYPVVTTDPLLAAIAGSMLCACGIGLIFKVGATSGGTDIIVKLLRLKYPYLKTSFLFLITDCIIVSASWFVVHDFNTVMYALISLIVMERILDWVLYGFDEAKLVYIISTEPQKIASRLMKEVDVGVTILHGEGGYSQTDKEVLLCAVRKQLEPQIEDIVKQEDRFAFLIVTNASEIYGEGHKSLFSEKL